MSFMSEVIHKTKKRVDLRHEALARELAEDAKNKRYRPVNEVMRAVGYSASTASSMAKRTLQSASFREVAESIGLTRDRIAKVISDAARANMVVTFKGEAIETDAPDHKTRLQAASLFGEFTGEKKTVIEQRVLNVDVPEDVVRKMVGLI